MLNLSQAVFRANAKYRLLPFEHLPAEQRRALGSLQGDPEFFGVLVPQQEGGLTLKSVCRTAALAWYAVQQPGVLPRLAREGQGGEDEAAIHRLVLDQVLEVKVGDGFVSGIHAREALGLLRQDDDDGSGVIASLSRRALQYGQALDITDKLKLSARLYFYNRRAVTPAWTRRLAGQQQVARYVRLGDDRLLNSGWREESSGGAATAWRVFRLRTPERRGGERSRHKLYVSPTVENVPDALEALADLANSGTVTYFKICGDLYTLFRPDKIVAYFGTTDARLRAAEMLASKLGGMQAQPVPFTSEYGGNGLLSFGTDPPPDRQLLVWQESESWRLWVTNRLASALVEARSAPRGDVEPWRYALERLSLEGVDVASWTVKTSVERS